MSKNITALAIYLFQGTKFAYFANDKSISNVYTTKVSLFFSTITAIKILKNSHLKFLQVYELYVTLLYQPQSLIPGMCLNNINLEN